jgi:hypothetical protein
MILRRHGTSMKAELIGGESVLPGTWNTETVTRLPGT